MVRIAPDVDPMLAIMTWLLWGTTVAAILLNAIYALVFSRKGAS